MLVKFKDDSDSDILKVGIGTIIRAGSKKLVLVVDEGTGKVGLFNIINSVILRSTFIEVEDYNWITNKEFDAITSRFNYTRTDWSFEKL